MTTTSKEIIKGIINQIEKQYSMKVAYASFIGSSNYLLNNDNLSDEDVLIWVYPNTRELYNGTLVDKQHIDLKHRGKMYDVQIRDIRKLSQQFAIGNTFTWEQLFSESIVTDGNIDTLLQEIKEMEDLFIFRHIRDLKSLAYNHKLYLNKGEQDEDFYHNQSSMLRYKKEYGYNTKSLSNLIRVQEMYKSMLLGNSYSESLILSKESRDKILYVKEGKLNREDTIKNMKYIIKDNIEEIDNLYNQLKDIYFNDYVNCYGKNKLILENKVFNYVIKNNYIKGEDLNE